MKKCRFVPSVAVAGVLAASLVVFGCGKSSSPTSPGGGGGGGNTPFNSGSLTAPADGCRKASIKTAAAFSLTRVPRSRRLALSNLPAAA